MSSFSVVNENGPMGSYVGILTFTLGGTVLEGLGDMVLLEELSHLGEF